MAMKTHAYANRGFNEAPRPYAVRDVAFARLAAALEAAGKKVFRLNIGDGVACGLPVPKPLRQLAGDFSMRNETWAYAASTGLPPAREAIAADFNQRHKPQKRVQRDQVFVTLGTSLFEDELMITLCNRGDIVLMPNPVYPLYVSLCGKYGVVPVGYRLDDNGQPVMADIEDAVQEHGHQRIRMVVGINPGNPFPKVMTQDSQDQLLDYCARHGWVYLNDAIYDRMIPETVERPLHPAASRKDVVIIHTDGLAKTNNMPGAKVGWGIICNTQIPFAAQLARRLEYNLAPSLGGNRLGQLLISEALTNPDCIEAARQLMTHVQARSAQVHKLAMALPDVKRCTTSDGPHYAWIRWRVKPYGDMTDRDHCLRLLREHHVWITPASGFKIPGVNGIKPGCRISLFAPEADIKTAFERIADFRSGG